MILLRTPRLTLSNTAKMIRLTRHFRGHVPPGLDPAGPWVNPDAITWGAMRQRRYFGPWQSQRGSLSFDGADDIVALAGFTAGATISAFAWMYPKALGEVSGGIYYHNPSPFAAGTVRSALSIQNVTQFAFSAGWSPNRGRWIADLLGMNQWQSVAASYDHGSATNDPLMYLNGSSMAVTENLTPSGTVAADGVQMNVGNDTDTIRTFDGFIGEFGLWNVILTGNENAVIHFLGPLAIPTGLQIYWPLWEATAKDFSGNARHGTVTGAVLAEDPPIPATRPSAYWIVPGMAAQALAATLTGIGLLQLFVFRELAGLLASIPNMIARRFVATVLAVTSTTITLITRIPSKLVAATLASVLAITPLLSVFRVLAATTSTIALMTSGLSRILAATTTTIGLLIRVPSKLLAATTLTTALVTSALSKVLAATTLTTALMTSGLSKALAATLTGIGLLHALKRIAQDRQGRWRPRFLIRMDWP